MQQHRGILKGFLQEIITGYFPTFIEQLNATFMVKKLLPIETWQPAFEQCIDTLKAFQPQPNIDYDGDVAVMSTFMNIAVFAWCHMVPKDAVLLCNRSNAIVSHNPLDLTKNRTFLGRIIENMANSLVYFKNEH